MHTSTVTVAVIPLRKNLVVIKDSDLKFENKTSTGPGGQNVNRRRTCVRCIHIPTGLVAESQESRSQLQNHRIALHKMTTLLNQTEYDRLQKEAIKRKQLQIGIAARSDKIRTYNFSQDRITDHRLSGNNNIYNIIGYMAGQDCGKLSGLIKRLECERQAELNKQIRNALEQSFIKQTNPKVSRS